MTSNRPARLVAGAALFVLAATMSLARPGGGNSYSGRSSSGGSSSGSSAGGSSSSSDGSSSVDPPLDPDERGAHITLRVEYYAYGALAILLLGLYGVAVLVLPRAAQAQTIDISAPAPPPPAMVEDPPPEPLAPVYRPPSKPEIIRDREGILNRLRAADPDFSMVLFEDFASTLYLESQRARNDPRALAGLAPYWVRSELDLIGEREPRGARVDAVVVGAMRPQSVIEEDALLRLDCEFEANLHLRVIEETSSRETGALTQFVAETWTFSRERSARTKPWTGVRRLGCPSCGAPLNAGGDARCPACGQVSGGGRFDWQVTTVTLHHVETRPHSLTGTSEESGTDSPTQFANALRGSREALFRDDPALSPKSIEARLRLIFETLQSSWAAQDLRPLRPFVSDRQYDALNYWIDAYKEQGLRNLMDNPCLTSSVIVRVERDAHYDAITLRVWATGCDYTVDRRGEVVGGSRTVERHYSEYWTLIRSARKRGTPRLDQNCPGCGGALILNMAGLCDHCGAHVTSGEFDWVLSKIEQDEAYRG